MFQTVSVHGISPRENFSLQSSCQGWNHQQRCTLLFLFCYVTFFYIFRDWNGLCYIQINFQVATETTTIIEALNKFVTHRISALPIVVGSTTFYNIAYCKYLKDKHRKNCECCPGHYLIAVIAVIVVIVIIVVIVVIVVIVGSDC